MYQQQKMNRIAIIGAGMTGISVAFQHQPNSHITIFDKSRRPGGRVCTRTSRQHPGYSFDHGAPFISPKGQFLVLLQKINAIKELSLKCKDNNQQVMFKNFYAGNPQIQTIPEKLMQQLSKRTKLNFQFNTRITSLFSQNQRNQYILESQSQKKYGPFDQIYVCIPYPQCKAIKQSFVHFQKNQVQSYFCTWVVMSAFDKNSFLSEKFKGYDILKNIGENIQSMVSQRTKGNTSNDDLWVFTLDEKWCQENINLKPQDVESILKQKVRKVLKKEIDFKFIKAHRWLYSKPKQNLLNPLGDKNILFGADWVGNRQDVQQSWELGALLYETMNKKHSTL